MHVCGRSAAMVRASVLRESGIRYEEEYSPAEDYRLWLRLAEVTRFHSIPEPLLDYRLYAGNTAKAQAEKMRRASVLAQEAAYAANPARRAAYLRLAKKVTVVRVLGVPVLRVETLDNRTRAKLFCALPVFSVKRSRKAISYSNGKI